MILAPIHEANDCHDPKTGRFAPKGTAGCAPTTPGLSVHKLKQLRVLLAKAQLCNQQLGDGMRVVLGRLDGNEYPYPQLPQGVGVRGSLGDVKSADRILEKADNDYAGDLSKVKDIVRGTIAADTVDDIPRVVAAIREQFEVVSEKDRFARPVDGYRDHLIFVKLPGGLVGELQVHLKTVLFAKNGEGHKMYVEHRTLAAIQPRTYEIAKRLGELAARSEALYIAAFIAGGGRLTREAGGTGISRRTATCSSARLPTTS